MLTNKSTPNEFLETHVRDLEAMTVDYAFLRNSQGYPSKITGDIDILIKKQDLKKVHGYYKKAQGKNIKVIQLIRKRQDLYVMLFFPQSLTRKFLVLEYYTGLAYQGQVIVPGESLIESCNIHGSWRRLSSQVSISYTFFHYIIYKGYLPSKYMDDFKKYGLNKDLFDDVLTFIGSPHNCPDTNNFLENPHLLRRRILQRLSRKKKLFNYLDQLVRLRPSSLGCVLNVNPADVEAVMEYAETYHLFRPTHRYVVQSRAGLGYVKKQIIYLLGGLAVVPCSTVAKRAEIGSYFEEKASS